MSVSYRLFFYASISAVGCQVHAVSSVVPNVVKRLPHNENCFTQGLLFWGDAIMESCGIRGKSCLREVKLPSWETTRQVDVADEFFAEGLALVPPSRLIQLTWTAGQAFEYDVAKFTMKRVFKYSGQGWGLCFQQSSGMLAMSDGSSSLFFRNAETFAVEREVDVRLDGKSVAKLNELECVNDHVYANIWYSNEIVRIDSNTGFVDCIIDAAKLKEEAGRGDVLNGIAYQKSTGDFLLTGKLWPAAFLVDVGVCGAKVNATTAQSAPTSAPASSTKPVGGDSDENECMGSEGYTWCDAKNKCIQEWEEECPGSTASLDVDFGGDRDEHGCVGTAGYTWCDTKKKCIREWEDECPPSTTTLRATMPPSSSERPSTYHGSMDDGTKPSTTVLPSAVREILFPSSVSSTTTALTIGTTLGDTTATEVEEAQDGEAKGGEAPPVTDTETSIGVTCYHSAVHLMLSLLTAWSNCLH